MHAAYRPSISPGRADDVEAIHELLLEGWLYSYPNQEHGVSAEDIRSYFKEKATPAYLHKHRTQLQYLTGTVRTVVARDQGRVVGVCTVERHATHNELKSLYVLPSHHRRGIGGDLWRGAGHYLELKRETHVCVVSYNKQAIAFYKKLGFVDTGTRIQHPLYTGSHIKLPEIKMRLAPLAT